MIIARHQKTQLKTGMSILKMLCFAYLQAVNNAKHLARDLGLTNESTVE